MSKAVLRSTQLGKRYPGKFCESNKSYSGIDFSSDDKFFHNENDMMDSVSTIKYAPPFDGVLQLKIGFNEIVANPTIRSISIERRQCRFADESTASVYPIYTENVCKAICRINKAIELCGCRPLFYTFGKRYDWLSRRMRG